jgi:hypothetical protein
VDFWSDEYASIFSLHILEVPRWLLQGFCGVVELISLHTKPANVRVQAYSIRKSLNLSVLLIWALSFSGSEHEANLKAQARTL